MSTPTSPAVHRTLTIGTRGSKLALVQTQMVRDALLAQYPDLDVQTLHITTKGDLILDKPLAALGDKGLFITEIEDAMRDGRVDLAVHSAKDLPSELPPDMQLAAILPRADVRDVLVSRMGKLNELPHGARVGTSSPRRASQLRALRPDLTVLDIRGNVDTRLRKLHSGDYDAIVLAAAGLDRLALSEAITEWLDPQVMVPAVAQGALGIEIRANDTAVADLIAPLNDRATVTAVRAERAFLSAVGGGCSAAIAAHAQLYGDRLTLTGMIGALDGRKVQATLTGSAGESVHLGHQLATHLLAEGGADLLKG